jgi:hypothetical protein
MLKKCFALESKAVTSHRSPKKCKTRTKPPILWAPPCRNPHRQPRDDLCVTNQHHCLTMWRHQFMIVASKPCRRPQFQSASCCIQMRFANSTTAFRWRAMLRAGLAVMACLFIGAIAVEKTHASCGDYLVMAGVDHELELAVEEPATDTSQTPLRSPCDGPQCRQSPRIPSPPLPTESEPGQHERANIQRVSDFHLPSPFCCYVAETSARAVAGFPFRLERPPHC